MINISTDIISSLETAVSSAVISLWPVFAILISITLAFYVLRNIIFTFTLVKR